ncbi:MAG: alginate export family protein [Candidatus Krumholzibacteriia bacterium]
MRGNIRNSFRRLFALRVAGLTVTALMACVFLDMIPAAALAVEPEYMQLGLTVGKTLEIKGYFDKNETFVATDIEELANPRLPKLRGAIQKIDKEYRVLTMYGMAIEVGARTSFIDTTAVVSFDDLHVGQQIEVACKVRDGQWVARKIKTRNIKKSNKIKGTLTGVHIDGAPPDTIEVSGLVILLNHQTDVNDRSSYLHFIERELFGDVAAASAMSLTEGIQLANGFIFVNGEYRHVSRSESNFDLSPSFLSDEDDMQPDVRLEMAGFWHDEFRTYARARFRKKYIINSEQNRTSDKLEAQFIELYALAPNIGGSGIAVQVGRQDFDEPREWIFDDYLDAVRAYYYGTDQLVLEGAVIHAVDALKDKLSTWTDVFAQARWYPDKHNQLGAYFLLRSDTAARNREPLYVGVNYRGRINRVLRPWLDAAILRGEDKGEDQSAWAVDLGATLIARDASFVPSLTVAYAIATGDETGADQTSQNFRQTGYQDNVARFGGVTTVRYYGELLDPELSNLKVFTAGVGMRPVEDSSVEVIYHFYRQHQPDNKLRGSNLTTPPALPNGFSTEIGWGVDLVAASPKLWDHVDLTWTTGFFRPGAAFDPRREDAWLNKFEVRLGF